MGNKEERKPGEILVDDKVNTPDGLGVVTSVSENEIGVDLDNKQQGIFKPRYITLA